MGGKPVARQGEFSVDIFQWLTLYGQTPFVEPEYTLARKIHLYHCDHHRLPLSRLPGQQYDNETGLHYNRHRYFNLLQGWYITQHSIGLRDGLWGPGKASNDMRESAYGGDSVEADNDCIETYLNEKFRGISLFAPYHRVLQ